MLKNVLLANSGAVGIVVTVVVVLIVVMLLLMIMTRIKTCPPDKVLVVYGKNKKNKDGTYKSSKCIHGGIAFVAPFVQKFTYLDLTPLSMSVDLKSALSKQNIRIDVPSIFTVGISTDPAIMQNAAERLLGLTLQNISDLAKDIIFGQLRLVIATMEIEEINTDRDKFLDAISRNVEGELKKIGLKLINVNVTDISDESGYIIALGKEAAAKAINEARISVAEEDKKGSIGQANAKMQERISVAEAESAAITGENKAKADIAQSKALLREKEAESLKIAVSAEKIQEAKALQESYAAQQQAEHARAAREQATREADIIVAAEIEKKKKEIDAEAEAEQMRRKAKAVNFGIVYGIGAFSLSQDIGVSVAEADRYIKNYLDTFSGVRRYMEETVEFAQQHGYIETMFGRRRALPEIHSTNKNIVNFGKRVAMNTPIQGTAADIIKIAMIKVYRRLKAEQLSARLILQVHDELIVEAPLHELEQVKHLLVEEMQNAVQLSVLLKADVGCGKSWLDAK